MEHIQRNIDAIREQIELCAQKAGKKSQEITLMAVAKTYPVEYVEYAKDVCGVTCFGENRVQEIEEKYAAYHIPDQLHMIGHLQSNKVKKVLPFVSSIDSVDSLKLLEKIQKTAEAEDRIIDVLLEVNTSGEDSKSGFIREEDLFKTVETGQQLSHIRMKGLMTIGPLSGEEEDTRKAFRSLRELYYSVIKQYPEVVFDTLSMGMTGDYCIAIEEGSTLIRVGTGIFGQRNYG
ncbi:MAG: YggS family pyridoxal phosphate-dependent enzyme [Spirochaetota bacterium]